MRWLAIVTALGLSAVSARAEHVAGRTFTTADGLANGRVYHMTRDAHGFLWFATADGVSRFDGARWEAFGMDDGLPDGDCRDVLAAADGTLWVSTDRGLAMLPLASVGLRPHFTAVHVDENRDADFVGTMFEDAEHRIWLGSEDGLWRLEAGQPRRVALGPDPQPAVYAFAEDRGALWLGTSRGLVRRGASGAVETYPVQPVGTRDDRTIELRLDRGGRLWVGGVGAGVYALVPPPLGTPLLATGESLTSAAARSGPNHDADGKIQLPRAAGEIRYYTVADGLPYFAVRRGIYEDRDGVLWLAGEYLVSFDGERFRTRGRANGFPEESMTPLGEDDAGHVWFGGLNAGVMRYARHGLTTYDELDGLSTDRIMAVTAAPDGEVIPIGMSDVHVLQRKRGDHYVAVRPRPPPGVETIGAWGWNQLGLFDADGRWWQPTQTGLDHYPHVDDIDDLATTAPRRFTPQDGLPGRDIYRLFSTRSGDVWIATLSHIGVARWNRATDTVAAVALPGLPRAVANAFAEDARGRIWIAYADGTIAQVAGDRARVVPLAPARNVEALLVDDAGRLWAGSDAGLFRIDDLDAPAPHLVRYSAATGLSTDHVAALVEDRYHRIYVGTVRGVDRLDPRTGEIGRLTIADGLPSDLLNGALRDRTGGLWFATNRGIAHLVPDPPAARVAAPIYLTGLRAAGRQVSLPFGGTAVAPRIELAHDASSIDVTFTSPSYSDDTPVLFQLQLAGAADDTWSTPSASREARLAHLAPGTYALRIRSLRAGIPSPPIAIEVEVRPPIWQRTSVRILALLVITLAAWLAYRWRVRHLLAVERVRARIARDVHDDIGASLSRISMLSEVAARRARTDAPVAEIVDKIGVHARELAETTSEVVWSTDPKRDDLASLLVKVRTFAGDVFEANGMLWTLAAPPEPERITLSPEVRRHTYLILKEALNNAARHSRARTVEIVIRVGPRMLEVRVDDDGAGFDQPREGGNGLRNMAERARAAGGRLTVTPRATGGTRIELAVPRRPG